MKENPNCKTIKCKLDKVLHKSYNYDCLFNVISRTNKFTFIVSHFIRAFILFQYKHNKKIPDTNKAFIMSVFKLFAKSSCGPKKKSRNNLFENELKNYYENHFCKKIIGKDEKIIFDQKNLSYVIQEVAVEMEISFTNNIQINYFKYVCQFVNQYFKKEHEIEVQKCKNNKKEKRKELRKELSNLKDAMMNNTLNYNPKYENFIKEYTDKIFPDIVGSYEADIKVNKFKYIKHMLFMSNYLEENNYS